MILVTGATGHTGRFVVQQLLERFPPTRIRCLVRPTSDHAFLKRLSVSLAVGNLESEADVWAAMQGVETVIHIANIRFSPVVATAAAACGAHHVVLVHTTGMFSRYQEYAAEYQRIEETVCALLNRERVNYTIIRPTMIYGGFRDYNFHKLILVLSRVPVFPLFGDGNGRMQPVHAEDLATSIVNSVHNPQAYNRSFNVSGGSVHTYREILVMVSRLLGRRVLLVSIPLQLSIWLVRLLSSLRLSPVTVEQVKRLSEDKVFDHSPAREALGFRPRDLETGLRQQMREMGVLPDERSGRR